MSKKNEETLPKVNPEFKKSVGSAISNPIPDDEYLTTEGNKKLKSIIIYISIDFIVTLIMLLENYDFLYDVENNSIYLYIARTILCIICFSSLIALFCLHKLLATKIARWAYFILGIAYYALIIILRVIDIIKIALNNQSKSLTLSIIFLVLQLGTIIPRILVFFISKKYLKKLMNLDQIRKLEEQEKFVESIATRIEKGYKRWSHPNMSYSEEEEIIDEDKTKHLFEKKEININDNDNSTEDNIDNNDDLAKIKEIMSSNDDNLDLE